MLIDRALNVITQVAWVLLGLFIVIYLVHTALRKGFTVALRALFSYRLLLVVIIIILVITVVSESLVFIEPQEVAVVVSLIVREGYRDRPIRSGLHWIFPLMEQVYRYPIYWQTYTMSSKPMEGERMGDDSIAARTSDGQEVLMDCSVIFQIDPEQTIRIHIDWQERYIEDYVRPVLRGLIRTQVSQYTVDEVNSSKRLDLEKDLGEEVRRSLEDKGFIMDLFVLRNIAFSPEYANSVEMKQVAQQQVLQTQYQADQVRRLADGEADRVRRIADAEAQAVRVKAQAEADALKVIAQALEQNPDLITYRYVDKLAPGIQVMLVPNNAPYLLPLPTLEPTAPSSAPAVSVPATVITTTQSLSPTVPITP